MDSLDPTFLRNGVLFFLILVSSLCVHEWAHAWTAWKLGDDTAWHEGRVTLNPLNHIDLVGTVIFPLICIFLLQGVFLFGWAKPVPVNVNRFKNPRLDDFLTTFAGPFSNLLIAIGVAVVGVLQGIVIAIVLSILTFLWQVWRPYDATLGRVRGRHGYHDIARNPEAEQIPGMVIYRFDAPIFFANAEHFARCVKRHIAEHGEPVRRVLIAGEPITDIDTTGVESLRDLLDDLAAEGITVVFAEVKGQVKDRLQRYGVFWDIGEENFYYTVDQAVAEYVLDIGEDPVGWVDDYSDAQPEEEREGPVPVEPGPTEQLGPPEPSEPTA